jgi:phage-related minor tail protein
MADDFGDGVFNAISGEWPGDACCCRTGDRGSPSKMDREMRELNQLAATFARTISGAFKQGIDSGKSFDDVLKRAFLRLSDMALQSAFKPLEKGLSKVFQDILSGIFGGPATKSGGGGGGGSGVAAAFGAITPFAAGGVIGTPAYFPLSSGGLGLAGEAGPEAILPLTRTAGGRLGVAAAGGASPASIVVNIATPDADSFRRSEIYVTGQIARAVARGQRGL